MQHEVDGRTAVYGLIGNPVGHSFSPLIHNTIGEGLGQNLIYTTFLVAEKERIGDAVRGAYALGIQGLNVTVPYKGDVIPFVADVDPVAKAIGAVNTLVRVEGGFKGYNTDYMGLRRALEEMGIELSSMQVILIGAGGAARAAGFMCGDAGVHRLCILNRTMEKAEALACDLRKMFPDMVTDADTLTNAVNKTRELKAEDYASGILAIQCTNVGLAPAVENVPIEDTEFYQEIDAAYDCIYNPEETKFLQLVHAAGKPGRNGMDMLLWQGILAFHLWTGLAPDGELTELVRNKLTAFIHAGE